MNQIELARHPAGHMLYVHPWKLKAPWVTLKLMLHGQRLRGSQRAWLYWNCADQRFSSGGGHDALGLEMPHVYGWVYDTLVAMPDGWVADMALSHSELSEG
jgi:hypothetical protein